MLCYERRLFSMFTEGGSTAFKKKKLIITVVLCVHRLNSNLENLEVLLDEAMALFIHAYFIVTLLSLSNLLCNRY